MQVFSFLQSILTFPDVTVDTSQDRVILGKWLAYIGNYAMQNILQNKKLHFAFLLPPMPLLFISELASYFKLY